MLGNVVAACHATRLVLTEYCSRHLAGVRTRYLRAKEDRSELRFCTTDISAAFSWIFFDGDTGCSRETVPLTTENVQGPLPAGTSPRRGWFPSHHSGGKQLASSPQISRRRWRYCIGYVGDSMTRRNKDRRSTFGATSVCSRRIVAYNLQIDENLKGYSRGAR